MGITIIIANWHLKIVIDLNNFFVLINIRTNILSFAFLTSELCYKKCK